MIQRKYASDPVKREMKRIKDRERKQQQMADKEARRRHNESQRMANRLRKGSKPLSEEEYLKTVGRLPHTTDFDAKPLIPYMNAWLDEHPAVAANGSIVRSTFRLATESGVNDKRLRGILDGSMDTIYLADADKLCIAMGTALEWVYRDVTVEQEIAA